MNERIEEMYHYDTPEVREQEYIEYVNLLYSEKYLLLLVIPHRRNLVRYFFHQMRNILLFCCMRKVYCISQNGSNPAYKNGIIAVCTSLRKAIKLISERYEYDVDRLKPKEYYLKINGILTHYRLTDKENNAWMKVEITEEKTNKIIR